MVTSPGTDPFTLRALGSTGDRPRVLSHTGSQLGMLRVRGASRNSLSQNQRDRSTGSVAPATVKVTTMSQLSPRARWGVTTRGVRVRVMAPALDSARSGPPTVRSPAGTVREQPRTSSMSEDRVTSTAPVDVFNSSWNAQFWEPLYRVTWVGAGEVAYTSSEEAADRVSPTPARPFRAMCCRNQGSPGLRSTRGLYARLGQGLNPRAHTSTRHNWGREWKWG